MNPTDLLGRAYAVGDLIAWPIQRGSSGASMSVGRVVEFLPPLDFPTPREGLEYRVKVKPMRSSRTYNYSRQQEYVPRGFLGEDGRLRYFRDSGKGVRPVILTNVENIIKIDGPVEDVYE